MRDVYDIVKCKKNDKKFWVEINNIYREYHNNKLYNLESYLSGKGNVTKEQALESCVALHAMISTILNRIIEVDSLREVKGYEDKNNTHAILFALRDLLYNALGKKMTMGIGSNCIKPNEFFEGIKNVKSHASQFDELMKQILSAKRGLFTNPSRTKLCDLVGILKDVVEACNKTKGKEQVKELTDDKVSM